jgi:CheY-like chemotaxis protein
MSHEFRTPVVGVISMASLLLVDDGLGKEQRKLAGNIHRSAKTLLDLVNDILDFSKTDSDTLDIEAIQFAPLPIIRDLADLLKFAAELKGLAFHFHIATNIKSGFQVMGDPGRLRQVLANLLANSITADQGYVKFTVIKEHESAETATLKFVVEDTGRMTEEDIQTDTSTAKKSARTEHGLSISKSVVELMKGRIKLDSTPGIGTTVTLWIPFNKPLCSRVSPDPPRPDSNSRCNSSESTLTDRSRSAWRNSSNKNLLAMLKPEEALPLSQRGGILILVAEDNPINQQFAVASIKKLGFQATAVNNGQEALSYMEAASQGKQAKPKVILMDIQMPIIDGYGCTDLLRHGVPIKYYADDVPIVALTASAIEGDKEKCKAVGMDDYMSKPITIDTLERVLVRWSIQGRTAAPPLDRQTSDLSDSSKQSDCDTPGTNSGESRLFERSATEYDGTAFESWCPMS